MQRFPIGKYLGINIFLWGFFLMLQGIFHWQFLLLVR